MLSLIHVADSSIFLWPVVILFYYKVSGSASGAGVLLSARAITSAIGELPLGIFSDRYGRARTTQFATFFYLISALLTALSWWSGFWMLLIAVVLQGIAESAESGNHDSLLYESSASVDAYEKTSARLGTYGSVFGMTSAVMGGFMGAKSLLIVASASIAPRLVSFVASIFLHNVRHSNDLAPIGSLKESAKELWTVMVRDREVRFVLIGKTIADGFGEVSWQYRALFVSTVWPLWALGLSMPLTFASHAVGGLLYEKNQQRLKKYGPLKILFVAAYVSKGVLIISYALQSFFSPILIGIAGINTTFTKVSFTRFLHGKLHDKNRATGFSAHSLVTTAMFSVTSIIFGVLIDHIGIRWALTAVAICAFTSVIFYRTAVLVSRTKAA